MTYNDAHGNGAPESATHFDKFWKVFLKDDNGVLKFFDGAAKVWATSHHRDGVAFLGPHGSHPEEVVKL